MRSDWYQNFEDPTIHVTVATAANFWGLKFQSRFIHAKLHGRDLIFDIVRSFALTCENKISRTPCEFSVFFRPRAINLLIEQFISSTQENLWLADCEKTTEYSSKIPKVFPLFPDFRFESPISISKWTKPWMSNPQKSV